METEKRETAPRGWPGMAAVYEAYLARRLVEAPFPCRKRRKPHQLLTSY